MHQADFGKSSQNRLCKVLYLLMKTISVLCLLAVLSGCFSETTYAPSLNLSYAVEPISLAEHVSGDWETLCVLGPYSDDVLAQEVLGFHWPLETNSSVWVNDGASLLIFIKNKSVQSYFEVSIRHYDFNYLDEQCINRDRAIFSRANGQVVVFTQL